jgi:septum formation protein
MSTLILGSSSPRRRELLSLFTASFAVRSPDVDERIIPGESPEFAAMRLASAKLAAIIAAEDIPAHCVIITADTLVAVDTLVLGKPESREDAERMIRLLAGRTHRVITALAIHCQDPEGKRSECRAEVTRVSFRTLSDNEIGAYLDSAAWHDKAGAYGIQEHGGGLVSSVDGSVSNVVGFPVRLFLSMTSDMGIDHIPGW